MFQCESRERDQSILGSPHLFDNGTVCYAGCVFYVGLIDWLDVLRDVWVRHMLAELEYAVDRDLKDVEADLFGQGDTSAYARVCHSRRVTLAACCCGKIEEVRLGKSGEEDGIERGME